MAEFDIMELKVGEVICFKCNKLFNMDYDGEKFWIKSDDKIPFVRCKECYPHPDDTIKPDFSKYKQTCLC